MKARILVVASAIATGLSVGSVWAAGTVTLPYTNDFESYPDGFPIATTNGWYAMYDQIEMGIVTNFPDPGLRSPYMPVVTHSNVLNIDGTVSNVFTPDVTVTNVYVDFLVRPQHRSDNPEFGDVPETRPDVAAFINAESNLVFYHTFGDGDYPVNQNYRPVWSTNTWYVIPSNEWVRLTFEIAYGSSGYYDSYFQIRINGGPAYFGSLGYPYPGYGDSSFYPPPGGTWFLCGNLPNSAGNDTFSSFSMAGKMQVDDMVASTSPPPDSAYLVCGNASVVEGDSGMTAAVFRVTMSATAAVDVTVSYATADGSAEAGFDYVATNGTLLIPSGSTSATVTVWVLGDVADERPSQTFYVDLSHPTGSVIALPRGTGTIVDDDAPRYTSHLTPYSWLERYGLVSGGNYESADTNDVDGDGMVAWGEYWAGTDPTNYSSVFRIIQSARPYTIRWLGGTNEVNPDFLIYRSTNLGVPDAWSSLPFTNIPRNPANLGTNTWTDPDGASFGPRLYYMITTPTNAP